MAKFDIRKFASENKTDELRKPTWLEKALKSDPDTGWQIVDLIREWVENGPIKKDYPVARYFARMLCKLDCVDAGEQSVYKTVKEIADGHKKLPSQQAGSDRVGKRTTAKRVEKG